MAPQNKNQEQESIIAAVREYPSLYNKKHPKFRNGPEKKKIWDKIAKNLNLKNGITRNIHYLVTF